MTTTPGRPHFPHQSESRGLRIIAEDMLKIAAVTADRTRKRDIHAGLEWIERTLLLSDAK